jgi:hypothetical protein
LATKSAPLPTSPAGAFHWGVNIGLGLIVLDLFDTQLKQGFNKMTWKPRDSDLVVNS